MQFIKFRLKLTFKFGTLLQIEQRTYVPEKKVANNRGTKNWVHFAILFILNKLKLQIRIREYEEANIEQKKQIKCLVNDNSCLNDNLNKAHVALQEENEAYLIQ